MKKLLTLSIALLSLNLYGAEPSVWPRDAVEEKAAKKALELDGNSSWTNPYDRLLILIGEDEPANVELLGAGFDGNFSRNLPFHLRGGKEKVPAGKIPEVSSSQGLPPVDPEDPRGRVGGHQDRSNGGFALMWGLFFIMIAVKVFSPTK